MRPLMNRQDARSAKKNRFYTRFHIMQSVILALCVLNGLGCSTIVEKRGCRGGQSGGSAEQIATNKLERLWNIQDS